MTDLEFIQTQTIISQRLSFRFVSPAAFSDFASTLMSHLNSAWFHSSLSLMACLLFYIGHFIIFSYFFVLRNDYIYWNYYKILYAGAMCTVSLSSFPFSWLLTFIVRNAWDDGIYFIKELERFLLSCTRWQWFSGQAIESIFWHSLCYTADAMRHANTYLIYWAPSTFDWLDATWNLLIASRIALPKHY